MGGTNRQKITFEGVTRGELERLIVLDKRLGGIPTRDLGIFAKGLIDHILSPINGTSRRISRVKEKVDNQMRMIIEKITTDTGIILESPHEFVKDGLGDVEVAGGDSNIDLTVLSLGTKFDIWEKVMKLKEQCKKKE